MIKVNTILSAKYLLKKNDNEAFHTKFFNTQYNSIENTTELDKQFNKNVKESLLLQMSEFEGNKKGWPLSKVINFSIDINKHNPIHASSYLPLPADIKKKCMYNCVE